MNIIGSGANASGVINVGASTELIKVRSTGATAGSAVVKFGKFSVQIETAARGGYEEIWGNFNQFTVTSGNVDWVAFG